MLAYCIKLNRECADSCAYLEQALIKDTEFASDLAAVCAKIRKACGEECRKHADMHEHCEKCAEACKSIA